MILQSLVDFAMWLLETIFSVFSFIPLPTGLITSVLDIMKFGAFIIGGDLLSLIFTCVLGWLTFKFSSGLILFIYRLIPLT